MKEGREYQEKGILLAIQLDGKSKTLIGFVCRRCHRNRDLAEDGRLRRRLRRRGGEWRRIGSGVGIRTK